MALSTLGHQDPAGPPQTSLDLEGAGRHRPVPGDGLKQNADQHAASAPRSFVRPRGGERAPHHFRDPLPAIGSVTGQDRMPV